MLNRFDDAVADCGMSLTRDPKLVKVHNRQGRALLKLGRPREARTSFEAARTHAHMMANAAASSVAAGAAAAAAPPLAYLRDATAEAETGLADTAAFCEYVEAAIDHQAKDDFREVLCNTEGALAHAPAASELQQMRTIALRKLKRWPEVLAFCERCSAFNAKQVSLPAGRGGDSLRAALAGPHGLKVAAALRLEPLLAENYALALRYCEKCEESESVLRALLGAQPQSALAQWAAKQLRSIEDLRRHKEGADASYRRGKYHAAVAIYTEALHVDPLADVVNTVL